MTSESEWGFPSKADETFIGLLKRAVQEAMPRDADGWAGLRIRLVLKDGDVIEGLPEQLDIDAENAPAFFNTPLSETDREAFGPVEVTVTIAGGGVLAQQIREFVVLLGSP